jgi:hypothetical protein
MCFRSAGSDVAFEKEFTVFVNALNKEASKAVAQAARDGQKEITGEQQTRRGVAPGVISAVDGDQSKKFEDVRPDGQIILLFNYGPEIVKAAFEELVARSPIGPAEGGHYRDEHFVQLDGTGLAPMTVPTAEQLAKVSRIVITNPMPYARKLEVGVTQSGGPFVKDVNPHIFESVMQIIRREFNAAAKISFNYVDLASAYVSKAGTMRYPAIIIERI